MITGKKNKQRTDAGRGLSQARRGSALQVPDPQQPHNERVGNRSASVPEAATSPAPLFPSLTRHIRHIPLADRTARQQRG